MPNIYYDNTRLSSYKECPRKFYFRHIRHIRGKGIAKPLIFGLAWHEAMDVVWGNLPSIGNEGKDDETVLKLAIMAFLDCWVEQGAPHPDDMSPEVADDWMPRHPGVGAEMLWNYIQQKKEFISECEILNIERPIAVPIDPDRPDLFYIGRIDKEVKHRGRVYFIEHKSTTAYKAPPRGSGGKAGFRFDYLNSWTPNSQVDGYLHVGHMYHGDAMKSVYVDAALVHKNHHDCFKFIPIERVLAQLDASVEDTREWILRVEADKAKLREIRANGSSHMGGCFPKNTESCQGKYGTCGYHALCKFKANPETMEREPDGYMVEVWEPFSILGLEELGLEPEEFENV